MEPCWHLHLQDGHTDLVPCRTHATYDHFKNMQQDSCEEALAMARDAHWWTLVAATLLEENIKQLSHSVTHG